MTRETQRERIVRALTGRAKTVEQIVTDTGICEGSVGAVLYGNQHVFERMKVVGVKKRVWKLRARPLAAR